MADLDPRIVKALSDVVDNGGVYEGERLAALDPGIELKNLNATFAVAPATTCEVSEVLKICNRHKVAVVTQGGRTGLAGGAVSSPGELLLLTHRMDSVVDIDPQAQIAEVETGATLATLQAAALEHGLSPGIDLAARDSATIGGMIATNAGGNEAFRNGVMRHRVVGLEAVLASGEIVDRLKRVTKANEGYDIKQLLIGSEGTLGVVTRAVLKLEAYAGERATALCAFTNARAAVALYAKLRSGAGPELRGAEIMWPGHARITAEENGFESLRRFMQADAGCFVIFEIAESGPQDRESFEMLLGEAIEAGDVVDAVIAANDRERNEIWRVREDSFAVQRRYPHGFWYDVSIPLHMLDGYIDDLSVRIANVDTGSLLFSMGHLGDGNLHLTVTTGEPGSSHYEAMTAEVYRGVCEAGGSFSAEHGIGLEKRDAMDAMLPPAVLALQRAIKQVFDPNNILNPGKVLAGRD